MSYPHSASFELVAPHYDALMRDVPYREWVRYLLRLIESRAADVHSVLDLACGTGNVSIPLSQSGFVVTGVDLSQRMIDQAIRKAMRKSMDITFQVQDAAELQLPGAAFDLCVSLFDSINYIVEPDRLRMALGKVYDHLRPGGLFIFDINSAFALENSFFDQENTMSSERLRYVWRSEYDAASRLCTVNMRFFVRDREGIDQEFRETHVQYAYREEELRGWLGEAGFLGIEAFQAYTMQPTRPITDRIFFVAERPAL